MGQQKKQIQINPELFKISTSASSSNKTRKNRAGRSRPALSTIVRPNSLKKDLLARVKQHQIEKQEKEQESKSSIDRNINIEKFTDDFNKSIAYLEKLQEAQKNKLNETPIPERQIPERQMPERQIPERQMPERQMPETPIPIIRPEQHNTEIKAPEEPKQNSFYNLSVNSDLPAELKQKTSNFISKQEGTEPPYGVLKGGSKPTYKEWKRETMKKPRENIKINPAINVLDNHSFETKSIRKNILDNLRAKLNKQTAGKKNQPLLNKRTLKNYETFGRRANKVAVLIKDRGTRKKIEQEKKLLKKHELSKIKDYLQEHGLLKVGSAAPEDVLREIYEKTFLTGEINNKNKDILVHNYLND